MRKLLSIVASALLLLTAACSSPDYDNNAISTQVFSVLYDSAYDRYGQLIRYSDYPLTVDTESGINDTVLVYNTDSLPYRSDIKGVRLTVSTSATMYIEIGYDQFQTFTSADSIDARKPVLLRAVGLDANNNVITSVLKLTINIHQVDMDSVRWTDLDNTPVLTGRTKSVIFNERLFIFTEDGKAFSTATTGSSGVWQLHDNVPAGFDYASPVVFQNTLYIIANGQVYSSSDGNSYELAASLNNNGNVEYLLGATSTRLAAVVEGYYVSTTGSGWIFGYSAAGFTPKTSSSCTYALSTNSEIEQVAVLGTSAGNNARHSLLVAEDELLNWSEWGPADSAGYALSYNDRTALIRYRGDLFYAFGGSDDFNSYYTSKGLYWTKNSATGFFPNNFNRRGDFSVAVDHNNYVYITFSQCQGFYSEVYKGRLNSYNF